MILPIVLVGVALFVLAFVGLNRLVPTIFGLVSVLGMILGLYFLWSGFVSGSENIFIWGCFLLLASGGVLVYLKSTCSE